MLLSTRWHRYSSPCATIVKRRITNLFKPSGTFGLRHLWRRLCIGVRSSMCCICGRKESLSLHQDCCSTLAPHLSFLEECPCGLRRYCLEYRICIIFGTRSLWKVSQSQLHCSSLFFNWLIPLCLPCTTGGSMSRQTAYGLASCCMRIAIGLDYQTLPELCNTRRMESISLLHCCCRWQHFSFCFQCYCLVAGVTILFMLCDDADCAR
mmetsp:Transcript_2229/g.8214  ORF Transcript_2229/g.8214 Transcript_2229/m.8214 type:complete len:208 (-) Transcript_2229:4393-5016(-)